MNAYVAPSRTAFTPVFDLTPPHFLSLSCFSVQLPRFSPHGRTFLPINVYIEPIHDEPAGGLESRTTHKIFNSIQPPISCNSRRINKPPFLPPAENCSIFFTHSQRFLVFIVNSRHLHWESNSDGKNRYFGRYVGQTFFFYDNFIFGFSTIIFLNNFPGNFFFGFQSRILLTGSLKKFTHYDNLLIMKIC